MKVAINTKIGGFHLSTEAVKKMIEYGHQGAIEWSEYFKVQSLDHEERAEEYYEESLSSYRPSEMGRADEILIRVIEELGPKANYEYYGNKMSDIRIVEIPDGIIFYIHESEEGIETIHEIHRVWYWNTETGSGNMWQLWSD